MDNAPIGADNDSRCPWNDKKEESVTGYICLCISKDLELSIPEGKNFKDYVNEKFSDFFKKLEDDNWFIDEKTIEKE